MKNVYEKHNAAFDLITSGALVLNGVQVGTIAFKAPKLGQGRLTCYLHLHGYPMVSGTASGYGYDKKAAAFTSACESLSKECLAEWPNLGTIPHLCDGLDYQAALKKVGIDYFKAI